MEGVLVQGRGVVLQLAPSVRVPNARLKMSCLYMPSIADNLILYNCLEQCSFLIYKWQPQIKHDIKLIFSIRSTKQLMTN